MPPARRAPARDPSPPPDPDQIPDPGDQEADSGASSRDSQVAGSPPGDFFEDEGPDFDGRDTVDTDRARHVGARPGEPTEQEIIEIGWDGRVVRELLETSGHILHQAAGKGPDDWEFTERELRAIAPPLTRILNRYPITAAAGAAGDEVALLVGLGGYTIRSIKVRAKAIENEEIRLTGGLVGVPPVYEPEHREATAHG